MQYDAKDVDQYLEMLENDWRKELLTDIRSLIKESSQLNEVISYKMLGYSDERGTLFHLNAQKNYVAFYVGDTKKIDPTGETLEGIDCGKGCLRFKKSTKLSETRLSDFIRLSVEKWNSGADIGC